MLKRLLRLRRIKKRKKPDFLRQEWFRLKSLGKKWRRPKGNQSKLRMHKKAKGWIPKPGYGSPKAVKYLHPSGLREVRVENPKQLDNINPKEECVRIASTVGKKKALQIMEKAKKLNIRVLNERR